MAIRGITFQKQTVSSNDDSHIYKILLNGREGTTKGCTMTFGKDDIYISDGYFFISNRLMEIPSMETVSTPIVASGTSYCRLVFEIDLSKTNTNSKFEQGYFKILTSENSYPDIVQEDLENGGNVYQLPFARFTKTVDGIGSFVSDMERIGVSDKTTIYVSTSGNDASGDGSEGKPFKTIQKAINSVPKDLGNKEIIINIASGTYSEEVMISGFYGGLLRLAVETVTINSLSIFDSCVVVSGTSLSIAASGKTYGLYIHRGANAILQLNTTITGSEYGIYCIYGSRLSARNTVTINSCTFAVACNFASMAFINALTGSKNNNGVQAAGGVVTLGSIVSSMASTLYTTTSGGRIYTGAQANVPTY